MRYLSLLVFFQPNVWNIRHDLLLMSINLSNIAILNIKSATYGFIISRIIKNEAINLTLNADLGILKFKKLNFTAIKVLSLLGT